MATCVCVPLVCHVCVFACSEVEGRDRLVKVDKQEKLVQLADELGEYRSMQY